MLFDDRLNEIRVAIEKRTKIEVEIIAKARDLQSKNEYDGALKVLEKGIYRK